MKRFHFPLDNVLRVKKHNENSTLAQYAEAVDHLTQAKDAATALKKQLTDEWRTHQEYIQQHPTPQMILQRHNGWAHIEAQIAVAEEAISEAENEVTRLSQELADKRQDRQSLETYRERAHDGYLAELETQTQREMDALSTRGHPRRR